MQKKHLRSQLTILLLLILGGCSTPQQSPENSYLSGIEELNLTLTGISEATAIWGNLEVRLHRPAGSGERLLSAVIAGRAQAEILLNSPLAGSGDSVWFERSLTGLSMMSSGDMPWIEVIPQQSGHGFILYCGPALKSESTLSLRIWESEADREYDKPLQPRWANAGNSVLLWPYEAAGNIALGLDPPDKRFVSQSLTESSLTIPLSNKSATQIVVIFGGSFKHSVDKIQEQLGQSRKELARAARDDLASQAAFTLNTGDDRTNRAFALLTAGLIGSGTVPRLNSHREIAEHSSLAVGLRLANRAEPGLVLPGRNDLIDRQVARFPAEDRYYWAPEACRAVLDYGIVSDHELSGFQSLLLNALSALEYAYVQNTDAILDPAIDDSIMRLVISHLRFADLMDLGEQISKQRGQPTPAGAFRSRSMRAVKSARTQIGQSERLYSNYMYERARPNRVRDRESAELEVDPLELPAKKSAEAPPSYPDTVSLLTAAARYGFLKIDNDPRDWLAARPAWDAFIWQRWLHYRFNRELSLAETSDYDSLLTVLLEGSIPGSLTDTLYGSSVSYPAANAAALQNLAEIYVGVRPHWSTLTVEISPRLPAEWGHTSARIPLATGFIIVEYDFVNERATVRIEQIDAELKVLFRYPLPSSNALTTQFLLSPARPAVKVFMVRESANRLRLEVEKIS
jgi:hypothetical protein